MSTLPVISLFSGAGGLDLAVDRCGEPPLEQDGTPGPLHVAVATDYEEKALQTLHANFDVPTITGDIRKLKTRDLLREGGMKKKEPALVIGGPPCTPFSIGRPSLDRRPSSTRSKPNACMAWQTPPSRA